MRNSILLFCLTLLFACSSGNQMGTDVQAIFASPAASIPAADVEKYKIGAGDGLSISVWRNPELSMSVPVRPDGFISMPLIGDIRAEGLDAESLAAEITTLLDEQLRNPQVTVVVSQVNSSVYLSRVRVTGAVRSPRSFPHARGMSVLDVILESGGPNEMAAANRARLYRTVDGEFHSVEIHLDDILLRGMLDTNYMLMPGDVITVPERLF